jgi:hypothetical protein
MHLTDVIACSRAYGSDAAQHSELITVTRRLYRSRHKGIEGIDVKVKWRTKTRAEASDRRRNLPAMVGRWGTGNIQRKSSIQQRKESEAKRSSR